MKDVVLITGANGMVAKHFENLFSSKYAIRFLTRKVVQKNQYEWDVARNYIDETSLIDVDHIIHLAGANIAKKRWSKKRKQELISSRVDSTRLLLNAIRENNIQLQSFISTSAIGYYGSQTSQKIHKEDEPAAKDFLGQLCEKWESVATQTHNHPVYNRLIILRFGIILSEKGGALAKALLPIKYYAGSPLGSGKQYFPWIHINDVARIIDHAITDPMMEGIFNTVAPEFLTNEDFTKKLAKKLNKPLFLTNVPKFILRLILGEMSNMLTEGSRVSANKIQKYGYQFEYKTIDQALDALIKK